MPTRKEITEQIKIDSKVRGNSDIAQGLAQVAYAILYLAEVIKNPPRTITLPPTNTPDSS